ncbi:gfo/Idh/MocA family oxidoreductase [Erysipelotrichaceae bacterium AF15-26LB]|nr:oxidoreductase, NAD-binding domain protein [Erysipelotrichaceae bacterium 3_1_53]MCR0349760.1 Gfo/Idh/MocA family oxidoreductase [[Clostridium] innocuum]RJV92280.1 gfo/Idh/MocA family oxidoreductase [Erysipelotrichaceae bacterium AF15-26LB]RJV92492.1 gfo/Idh/MocA family oxidoreductase [Erysipelotrichaceae bacterium AF19-24AC]
MKTWNWGILGQGVIASQMADALMKEHGGIYAVAGRHMDKVRAFAEKYTVQHCYDIESLLQDEAVDIVYIATPHTYHYDYMMKALRHGKHVLCEKAITVNHKQLQEVMQLAQEKGLIVMEAMTIFHMPVFQKARELVESGAIGKLKMLQVNFGSCKEYDVNNRFFSSELAGGALLDIGTYALSLVRWFLHEQPDTILTSMLPFETGVDEMSGIILRNSLDEMATVTLTMRAKLPKRGIIAGEDGYLEISEYPRANSFEIRYTKDGWTETIDAGVRGDALLYEVRDMEAVVSGAAENHTLQISSDVVSLMDEIRRQWGMKYPFE